MKRSWMLAAALTLGAVTVNAQTLYKLIDKNGKVTYSESAPKPGEFDGQVIRIDVDPNRNTATLPRLKETEKADGGRESRGSERPAKASETGSDPQSARERLEAAKKALADARENPGEGDVTWLGKVGGGARPVPSEAYQARLDRLEAAVKAAEEELKRAEGR